MSGTTLLADIGGTHARFALARPGASPAVGQPLVLATAEFPDLPTALEHARSALGARRVDAVGVCAAGPPRDGAIALTNCSWQVSESALAEATGVPHPLLVNDFTAIAAALPALQAPDLDTLRGGTAHAQAARAVVGPGTGLGVSALIPGVGADALVCGEGGHVDLAAATVREDAILARLRERFGHVSAERVLSGPGLANLYAAMHPGHAAADPAQIARRAADGDARATACVTQFCAWLGAVCGDVALTFGARGGLYLAGGIVPAWGEVFQREAFATRFVDKGRCRDYLARVPVYIISAPCPALTGLARLLARRGS